MSTVPLRGFYAILDVKEQAAVDLPVVLGRAEELLRARPACLQLRAKRLGAGPALVIARALTPLCRAAGVPFCVNDRLDLALAAEATPHQVFLLQPLFASRAPSREKAVRGPHPIW